jgi:hypothetical protein
VLRRKFVCRAVVHCETVGGNLWLVCSKRTSSLAAANKFSDHDWREVGERFARVRRGKSPPRPRIGVNWKSSSSAQCSARLPRCCPHPSCRRLAPAFCRAGRFPGSFSRRDSGRASPAFDPADSASSLSRLALCRSRRLPRSGTNQFRRSARDAAQSGADYVRHIRQQSLLVCAHHRLLERILSLTIGPSKAE